jgi:hypothetical protein
MYQDSEKWKQIFKNKYWSEKVVSSQAKVTINEREQLIFSFGTLGNLRVSYT